MPTVSPTTFRRLALLSVFLVTLIVLTGAAVRLTTSGLGCVDWPNCSQGHLTAPLQFHPLIEDGNRLVTVLLTIAMAVTFLAAFRLRPFRRDLAWLSAGLIGGVLIQIVMGAIVVYTKLNPYVVSVHFLASLPLVVDAAVLFHRCDHLPTPQATRRPVAPLAIRRLAWATAGLLGIVLAAGATTTGAGPHAGSFVGQQRAKRIQIPLRDLAELHSTLAILLVGVAVSLAVALHALPVPERVRRSARILVTALFAQAAVGYTQYFTHLPALLVELHVAGATFLVVSMTFFLLSLVDCPRAAPVASRLPGDTHAEARSAPAPIV